MIIGYARVSGVSQSLDEQVAQLKEMGCSEVYQEKITGTTADRPEFQKAIGALQEGDTLVVTKLDRFARSAEDGIGVIRELLGRGVRIHVLNMGVVEDTPIGRLLLTVMSGFAEFERDLIVERMAEGKEAARRAGTLREGRPRKYSRQQREHAMKLLDSHSYTEVERMTGISRATLTRYRRSQRNEAKKLKQANK